MSALAQKCKPREKEHKPLLQKNNIDEDVTSLDWNP